MLPSRELKSVKLRLRAEKPAISVYSVLITLCWLMMNPAAALSPTHYAVVIGTGQFSEGPIVATLVNRRSGSATQILRVLVKPAVSLDTPVRWSSPDGMNAFYPPSPGANATATRYDATIRDSVAVVPNGRARGDAIIVATVGKPVNEKATFYVRDVAGIGFGCYSFIENGASVRIIDGFAERASLATADVAVIGPGKPGAEASTGPGCWGENYDSKAASYRLVFRTGGRVLGREPGFVHELPFDEVDSFHPVEVIGSDHRVYRLHLEPEAGTYFTGWIDPASGRVPLSFNRRPLLLR